jgi:Ran-binding protein 3
VFGSTQPVGFGALSSAGTGSDGTTGGTISIFVGGGATTTSIAAATAGGPATGEGEGEEEERKKEEAPAPAAPAPSNVFGATTTTNTTSALPEEQPAATGEEREDVVYSVDGVLFEFDLVEKTWKERGRGEARVLVHRNTSAGRVVMRQKGNLRLLLNANLWKEMHLNRMDGGKGVTFAVINHALVGEGQENGGGGAPLATYAFRVKTEDLLENFIEAVDSHKGGRLVNV